MSDVSSPRTLRAPDRETGAAGVIIFVNRFVYQHDREKRTAFRETIKVSDYCQALSLVHSKLKYREAAGPKFGWSTATNSDEATVILVDPAQPGVDAEDDLTILNKIYSYHFVDDSLGRGCRLSLVNYKINIPVCVALSASERGLRRVLTGTQSPGLKGVQRQRRRKNPPSASNLYELCNMFARANMSLGIRRSYLSLSYYLSTIMASILQ